MAAGTIIVIGNDNTIEQQPRRVNGRPDEIIVFVVLNGHDRDHIVWIDPDEIVLKAKTPRRANPLAKGLKRVKVRAGGIGLIRQRIRPKTAFGKGKLPYGRYKYTFTWASGGGTRAKKLDPDIDVSPPMI